MCCPIVEVGALCCCFGVAEFPGSLLIILSIHLVCLADSVLMCYYPSTARLRTTMAKFEIKDINFTLCTHYIYQYAVIDNVTHKLVASDPQAEEGPGGLYRQFTNAKIQFPSIKTLLAVGEDNTHVKQECLTVGRNIQYLTVFVTSAVSLLRLYGFDGLDVLCPPVVDIENNALANILKALRDKFDEITSNARLMLTVYALAVDPLIQAYYDVPEMAKTVDYVIIATDKLYYDYMMVTTFPTPLYPFVSRRPYNMLGLNASLSIWNSMGMPYNKTVVGFTGLGRMFELYLQAAYRPMSLVTMNQLYGAQYKINKGLAYPEICEFSQQASTYYDNIQKSPYRVNNLIWVGFDDPESLQLKIEWVTQFGVAGIMFASIDVDDFTGNWCSDGKFPLLVAMNKALMRVLPDKNNTPMTTTTKSSTSGGATDSIVSVTCFKDTPDKNINVSNLLLGILIVLILIAYVVILFLCLRTQRHQHQAE